MLPKPACWRSTRQSHESAATLRDRGAALIPDGATVIVGGSGGIGVADEILSAVSARFTGAGAPRDLTVVHTTGIGDFDAKGLGHLAHKGLLKRTIGGNYGPQPRLMKLIVANEVEAYNLPQGVLCQLYRAIAAKQPGIITHVELHTYMDPRQSGGRMNAAAREDLIEIRHARRTGMALLQVVCAGLRDPSRYHGRRGRQRRFRA